MPEFPSVLDFNKQAMEVIEIKRPVLGASNIYVEKILALGSLNSTHSARFYTLMAMKTCFYGRIISFYVIFMYFAKLEFISLKKTVSFVHSQFLLKRPFLLQS